MTIPRPIDPATLDLHVEGHNLAGRKLAEVFGQQHTLLVFLRHHG